MVCSGAGSKGSRVIYLNRNPPTAPGIIGNFVENIMSRSPIALDPRIALLWLALSPALATPPEFHIHTPPVPGDAPTASPAARVPRFSIPHSGSISAPVAAIDNQNRTDVVVLYHQVYLASDNNGGNIAWTGNVVTCNSGTVSTAFQQDILRRINYYRVMTGLPGNVVLDPVKNQKSQAAALMMSANNQLSHNPSSQWNCYSTNGDEAAGRSNLHLGQFDADAVDTYIVDPGANNTAVGHRRWLLYPPARSMGSGSIPGGNQRAANAIWVLGDYGTRPASPQWTSWPNRGHVPHALIPPRWSFSYPGMDFGNASVTMTRDGQPIGLTVLPVSNGSGDNTLVWEPDSRALPHGAPAADITYRVTITGPINLGYEVIAIDPYRLHRYPAISGTASPVVNQPNSYTVTPVEQASAYRIKTARVSAGTWLEGAELGLGAVQDGTDASYSLIDNTLVASGTGSFHLAYPEYGVPDQHFVIARDVIPSPGSFISFMKRRRAMTPDQTVYAEISSDGGESWSVLWSQPGIDWPGDEGFETVNVGIGDHAGQVVRFRFRLGIADGYVTFYPGTGNTVGVHIDNIRVTQSQELVDIQWQTTSTGTFGFQPTQVDTSYYLMAQPRVGDRYFGFGPATVVTSRESYGPEWIFGSGFE